MNIQQTIGYNPTLKFDDFISMKAHQKRIFNRFVLRGGSNEERLLRIKEYNMYRSVQSMHNQHLLAFDFDAE